MSKYTKKEVKEMRDKIAQVAVGLGFSEMNFGKLPRVENLDENGVTVYGHLPGKYTKEKGLSVWSTASRYSRGVMSVSQLVKVEAAIRELHEEWFGDE